MIWEAMYDNPETGQVEYHKLAYTGESHRLAMDEASKQHHLWFRGLYEVQPPEPEVVDLADHLDKVFPGFKKAMG